jgi:membrane protease YdiL (CAAX protease family)
MHSGLIVLTAMLSSLGEEMFFRSFLTPWVGVIPQALLFAVLHQVPGPSRWVWVSWAAVAGLAFGGLYWAVGSLSGPLLAHAVINAVNLAHLRDHEPLPRLSNGANDRTREDRSERTIPKRDAA